MEAALRLCKIETGSWAAVAQQPPSLSSPLSFSLHLDGLLCPPPPLDRLQAVTNSTNTVYATKRLIGRMYDDEEVQRESKVRHGLG